MKGECPSSCVSQILLSVASNFEAGVHCKCRCDFMHVGPRSRKKSEELLVLCARPHAPARQVIFLHSVESSQQQKDKAECILSEVCPNEESRSSKPGKGRGSLSSTLQQVETQCLSYRLLLSKQPTVRLVCTFCASFDLRSGKGNALGGCHPCPQPPLNDVCIVGKGAGHMRWPSYLRF